MNISTLPEFSTASNDTAGGGGCECRFGGPAGDGGGDCGGYCHGDEEETQGLRTAAVDRGSCVHERCVQW